MTMAVGLIVSRFIHYLALSIVFGCALFPFYGVAPPQDPLLRLMGLRPLLLSAAAITLASGISWFAFTAGSSIGWIWPFRLMLAVMLIVLLLGRCVTAWRFYGVILTSLVLLASLALIGHAGEASFQHRILDALHLIASAVWVGALAMFSLLMMVSVRRLDGEDLNALHHALSRFSGVGTIAVATLILTGIINPGFSASLQSVYGQVLLLKLALFVTMLMLAAVNRFWLTPKFSTTPESIRGLETAMHALRVSILFETALAILVLAVVAWLGTLPL